MRRILIVSFFLMLGACTQFNTTDLTASSINVFGYALKFDAGSTDSMDIVASNGIPSAYTLEAWIKLDAYPAAIGQIFMQSYNVGSQTITLGVDSTGLITFDFSLVSCFGMIGSFTSTSTINVGQKYHIAVSNEGGAGSTRVFINGVLDNTIGSVVPSIVCAVHLTNLGADNFGGSQFPGTIDEFRFSDIASRYNPAGFTPPTAPFTSDANTIILFHADDRTTSGTLTTGGTYSFTGTPTYVISPFP